LNQFDVGTVIAMDTHGGYECFYKVSDEYDGWKHACLHPPHISVVTTFDVARNLGGSAWVTDNKNFYLDSLEKFEKIADLYYHRDSNAGSGYNFFLDPLIKEILVKRKVFMDFNSLG